MNDITKTHPSLKGKQCQCEDSFVEIFCYDDTMPDGWIWSEDVQKYTIDKAVLKNYLNLKIDKINERLKDIIDNMNYETSVTPIRAIIRKEIYQEIMDIFCED
jgi:hypothetical protein